MKTQMNCIQIIKIYQENLLSLMDTKWTQNQYIKSSFIPCTAKQIK